MTFSYDQGWTPKPPVQQVNIFTSRPEIVRARKWRQREVINRQKEKNARKCETETKTDIQHDN